MQAQVHLLHYTPTLLLEILAGVGILLGFLGGIL